METYRVFFDEIEFLCWAEADLADGAWVGSVLIERSADHAAMKEMIPMVRHTIRGQVFPDRSAAVLAAHKLARKLIEQGKVGL